MDEIESLIGLRPTPLTWPVVIAGDFLGVWDPPPSLPGAANHEISAPTARISCMLIERRDAAARLRRALHRAPVVLLTGPRQAGKTTLSRLVGKSAPECTFDAENPVDATRLADPMLALSGLSGLITIDEAQRIPDLFPVLRVLVDRPVMPARFLILGSASPDLVGLASESLAGRVELVELSGLTVRDVGSSAADRLWLRGGLPPSFTARSNEDSAAWRDGYITTFLERDLAQLGVRIPAATMRRAWTMLALPWPALQRRRTCPLTRRCSDDGAAIPRCAHRCTRRPSADALVRQHRKATTPITQDLHPGHRFVAQVARYRRSACPRTQSEARRELGGVRARAACGPARPESAVLLAHPARRRTRSLCRIIWPSLWIRDQADVYTVDFPVDALGSCRPPTGEVGNRLPWRTPLSLERHGRCGSRGSDLDHRECR
ncbi:conserved hypothetical protein [Mycobacterium tuberculosis T17]|nr:conserved hypothetical protein [Mycobacterium tuberculosis T17]